MSTAPIIPNRFLFKFEFPLYRCPAPPKMDGRAADWDEHFKLPALHTLDGQPGFGDVYAAWDDDGLYIACAVHDKPGPPRCDTAHFKQSDHLRLMTDMRDTRTIRRATRFCQQWYLMPAGAGRRRDEPVGGSATIQRAQDDAPVVRAGDIPIASRVGKTGYSLTAHLPARVLSGFDPVENPRIGFYYNLEDLELGHQSLTVGDDLSFWFDPSTWPTAVLVD
jgi:hypothetical protein